MKFTSSVPAFHTLNGIPPSRTEEAVHPNGENSSESLQASARPALVGIRWPLVKGGLLRLGRAQDELLCLVLDGLCQEQKHGDCQWSQFILHVVLL
ncbi:hypothetical protein PCASD_10364 [Puccinia coronata f. sp. avenae]|uniref:Uncharacterized protein n=1 Tax=Puccinia coronata f. sp. avenae TaxID=200324 RepID=A0A2N5UL09_9BASI|nr:hypothetical protein PCASD_10364 [Puccinia coronata f. sp. avenae]